MRAVITAVAATAATPLGVEATWSVLAVDRTTGRIVIASATCVPQGRFAGFPAEGLMDIQAIVVPGAGIAAAQAGVDATRSRWSTTPWRPSTGPTATWSTG